VKEFGALQVENGRNYGLKVLPRCKSMQYYVPSGLFNIAMENGPLLL